MTIEEAIRILDPETTKDEITKIRKANGSLNGYAMYQKLIDEIEEACNLSCKIMREYLNENSSILFRLHSEKDKMEQLSEQYMIEYPQAYPIVRWYVAGLKYAINIINKSMEGKSN